MTKRICILALSSTLSAVPLHAQPVSAPEKLNGGKEATISARELEERIGGRTMMELNLKNGSLEEATAALAKSSGLHFVLPDPARPAWARNGGPGEVDPAAVIRFHGVVPKREFWPGVRFWSQAEAVWIKREAVEELRQLEEKPPPPLAVEPGQKPTLQAIQDQDALQRDWVNRQAQLKQRLNSSPGVSVGLDPKTQTWSVGQGNEIAIGRAINSWPCLIVASKFQRHQSLSLQPLPKDVDQDMPGSVNGTLVEETEEAVEGGPLSDGLSLGLSVYLDPKVLDRVHLRIVVSEARDDAGEQLLSDRDSSNQTFALGRVMTAFTGGGFGRNVELLPRQAKGKKLAVLRGKVLIRYPIQTQQIEISNFKNPQGFMVGTGVFTLPAGGQFEPPQLVSGALRYAISLKFDAQRGGRALWNYKNTLRSSGWNGEGELGELLLPDPSRVTFTDSLGRTWNSFSDGWDSGFTGPDGQNVPVTSPPTPPPDNFTYHEGRNGTIGNVPSSSPAEAIAEHTTTLASGHKINRPYSPEEMAQVRFTKATVAVEGDWRTMEIPFEFHDLPLPPR